MDSPIAKYDSPEQRAALFDAINKNCGVNAEGKISLDNLLHFVREEIEVKFVDSQSLILRLTRSLQHGAKSGLIDFEDVCKIFQTWLEKQSSITQFKIIKPTCRSEEALSTPSYPLASSTPYTLRKELSFISHDTSFREETFYSACDSCGRDGSCCNIRSEVEKSSREESLKKYYEQKLQDTQNLLEHSEECNAALQNEMETLRETCNIYKSKEKRWNKAENQLVDREQQLSKLNNLLKEQKTATDAEVQRLRQQLSRLKAENEKLLSQCVLLEESKVKQNKMEKILMETKTKLAKIEVELNDKVTLLEIREEYVLQLEHENKKLQDTITSLQMPVHSEVEGEDNTIDPILGTSDESPERIPVIGNYLHIYPKQSPETMSLKDELQPFIELNLKPCENISTQTTQVEYECMSTQTVCVDSFGNVHTHTNNSLSSTSTQITCCMTKNESTQTSPNWSSSSVQIDELVNSGSKSSEGRAVLRKDHCAQFPCDESVNNAQNGCGTKCLKQYPERFESNASSYSNLGETFTFPEKPSFKNVHAQLAKISTKDKSLLNTDSQTETSSFYCTTYEIPICVMEDVSTQVDSIFIETERKNERATQTEKTIWHPEVPAPRAVQQFSNDPLTTLNEEEQGEYQSQAAAQETGEPLEANLKEDVEKCPPPPQATYDSEEAAIPRSQPRKESVDSNNNAAQGSGRALVTASLRPPIHGSTPRSSRPGSGRKETNDLRESLVNYKHTSGRIDLGFGALNNDGLPVLFFPGPKSQLMKSSWNLPPEEELQLKKAASLVSDGSPEIQHDSEAETSQELYSESEGAFARRLAAGREARRQEWAGREARVAAEEDESASEEPPERARRRQRSCSKGGLEEAMAALSLNDAIRFGLLRNEAQSKESSNTLRINEASQHVQTLLPTSSGSSEELFFTAEISKTYHDSSTSLQSNGGFLNTCKMESTDSFTFETVASSCNSSGTYAFNKVKFQKKCKKMHCPVSTTKAGKKDRKFSEHSTMAEPVSQKMFESRIYLRISTIFALLAASWLFVAFTCPCDGIVYHTLPYTMDRLRELFSIKYVYPYGEPPV